MINYKDIDFEDATVTAIIHNKKSVQLELEEATLSDNTKVSVIIDFKGIRQLLTDNIPVNEISMVYPDGEMLHLSFADHVAELITEWNEFTSHHSITRSYKIEFDDMDIIIKS